MLSLWLKAPWSRWGRVVRRGSGKGDRCGWGVGQVVGNLVEQATGIETRVTVWAHSAVVPATPGRILATGSVWLRLAISVRAV